MSDEVQALLDRERIREVRHQFAWALDTRDWELFASLFTDEVEVDLVALGAPPGPMRRADLVALFRRPFSRSVQDMGTQQLYGNAVVEVAGDTATARTYLHGHHHAPGTAGGEDAELRAVYTDHLVRTAGGWKIDATSIRVLSMTGNLAIFA